MRLQLWHCAGLAGSLLSPWPGKGGGGGMGTVLQASVYRQLGPTRRGETKGGSGRGGLLGQAKSGLGCKPSRT